MKTIFILLLLIAGSTIGFSQSTSLPKSKNGLTQGNKKELLYSCPMHPEVRSNKLDKCPKCNSDLTLSKKEQMKMEVMKRYTCPMHPDVVSGKMGKCATCGMTLVEKKAEKGNYKIKM